MIQDDNGGAKQATLSDGRTVTVQVPQAPAPIDLTGVSWSLAAEDWKPTAPYGTVGAAGAETTKDAVNLTLTSGLQAWPDIPELASASGIGTYTTTLTLPSDWSAANGATISLGQVTDTVTMKVNGEAVEVNQLSATADLGDLLRPGANQLEIVVATTLQNRLAQLNPATFYNTRGIQENGLVGPVVVTPYATVKVEKAGTPTTPPTPVAPVNTGAPVVDGTMKVGSLATCVVGSWTGAGSFSYTWLRDGVAIPGEKQATLRLIGQHLDKGIACEVTAANKVGSTSGTSAERIVVVGAALTPHEARHHGQGEGRQTPEGVHGHLDTGGQRLSGRLDGWRQERRDRGEPQGRQGLPGQGRQGSRHRLPQRLFGRHDDGPGARSGSDVVND